jgi:hypothetical protein
MLKLSLILSSILLLFSCGKTADEETLGVVLSANIALSSGECQKAIDTLENHGRVNTSAPYLKTLASAYACRAGYSTVTFFASDFALTTTKAPLGGLTLYSTSSTAVTSTLQNDEVFKDLQKAIDILLYAGGIASDSEPTSAARAKHFSSSVAGDIDTQLLYLVLVQLGRYMNYYGNVSAAGDKGGGSGSSTCFTSYTSAHTTITAAITAAAGTCTNITTTAASHSQLSSDITPVTRKTRLCQGVVLLNGLTALLPNVVASIFSDAATKAAALAAVSVVTLAQAALVFADSTTSTVAYTQNQSICENTGYVNVSNIESYFGLMFEGALQ